MSKSASFHLLPDVSNHKLENYQINQNRGQLCATSLSSAPPKRGSEVFLTNLPRDLLLQELHDFMSECGQIYEIRLLMDFSGYNRGFAYVKYFSLLSARMAVISTNGKQIKPGYNVKVRLSFDNNQLLMRGIPYYIKLKQVEEIIAELAGEGLTEQRFLQQGCASQNSAVKSCVLTYESHRQALEARKKLWPGLQIGNKRVDIDWAFPAEIGNAAYLYCKNIPENITAVQFFKELCKLFDVEQILDVQVGKGYGSILMANSLTISEALNILTGHVFWGVKLELNTKRFPEANPFDVDNESTPEMQCSAADFPQIALQATAAVQQNPLAKFKQEKNNDVDLKSTQQATIPLKFTSAGQLQMASTQVLTPPPLCTSPGLLNELEAVERALHANINFRHPLFRWIFLFPGEQTPVRCVKSVLVKLTVNDVTYEFLLALVPRF